MTRGRKKDLTIPATRSLVQQRDYRARKARHIADLEERCRRAEEENAQLKAELAEVKAMLGRSALHLPQTQQVAAELLQNLSNARDSLLKFQQIACSESALLSEGNPNEGSLPSPARSSPQSQVRLPPITALQAISDDTRVGPIRSSRRRLPPSYEAPMSISTQHSPSSSPTPSGDEGECCHGYFDCDKYHAQCIQAPMSPNSHVQSSRLSERTFPYNEQRARNF